MPRRRSRPVPRCEEPRRKWRKVIIYSDSDESEKSESEQQEITNNDVEQEEIINNSLPANELTSEPTPTQVDPVPEEPASELDAELLAALGDTTDDVPEYGEKILQDLAQRLLPILRKGIPKEKKDPFLKEYTIPENCKLLRSPSLNVEMAAAITDINRARDKRLETSQNQLGLGISAVGKGLSLLLTNDDKQNKIHAIKAISDGCRILADLHYNETQTRVKLVTPSIDKAFVRSIQDLERDETLFGSKLAEKIKASKTIEKQGLQIKRPLPVIKSDVTTSAPLHSTPRSRPQENWSAPSRYQSSNRGGRGGAQRYVPAAAAARKAQPAASSGQPYTPSGNRRRAPTR